MRRNKQTLVIPLLMLNILFCYQEASAQVNWRERIKENIKNRQAERFKDINISTPGDYELALQHDGVKRTYKLHIPGSYKRANPTPLVLAFHGGGGSSEIMARDRLYNFISKSEKEGFIVAFPNGASRLRSGKFATWNAGNCCGYARDRRVDDVGFVKKIIEELKAKLNVDSRRVFATGMSNGGMLSHRLACDLTDSFAAIAAVAGTDNTSSCNPSSPISIMHIHATDDDHVLFNGGYGAAAFRDPSKITDFTSVPETITRWVQRNNCKKPPKRVLERKGVYCDVYAECGGKAQVKLCVTDSGGHSWPGGDKLPRRKAASPSDVISATDEIWDFFKKP